MATNKFAPTNTGMRSPLDHGLGQNGKIDHPPRFAQIGGLKSVSRVKKTSALRVKRPGSR